AWLLLAWRYFFLLGADCSASADQPPPISGCTRASKPLLEVAAAGGEALRLGGTSLRPRGRAPRTMRRVSGALCLVPRVTPGVITENGLTMICGAPIEP